MKINGLRAYPLRLQAVKPGFPGAQSRTLPSGSTVIVRVSTDAGVEGLGEVAAGTVYFHQTMGGILDWLRGYAHALRGADPLDRIDVHRRMDQVSGVHPQACQPARAGIDLAIHDIAGKAFGCPVYELLGGAYRTQFELQTNLYEPTPRAMARACRDFVRRGYRALKIKVGNVVRSEGLTTEALARERDKLSAALAAVPDTIAIDADANQSWVRASTVVQMVAEIRRKHSCTNLSIEQPLHYLDLEGHRFVRERIGLPVVLDESVLSPEAVVQIVRQSAADRIVLKFNRVGGLWPAAKIVAICHAAGIGISLDTMPFTLLGDTANAHLAATIRDPYPADLEGFEWFADTPVGGGIELRNGRAILPRSPGLGVVLDEKKLEAMTISPGAWR